jgi:peptidoglycan/LPS O-acetylase OafA/YrhL
MNNYFIIAHDFDGVPRGIGVTWSLAVEEHYYFLYPPLVLLLLRLGRLRQAAWILALLCLLVLAWRTWLALAGASEAHLTMATDTRVDAILAGCVMALWRNPWLERPAADQRGERALAVLCLALLTWTLVYRNETFRLTARYTVQSLAIAPLIYLAVARAQQAPWRWLNSRPMVYLGNISYTVYLSHQLIFYVVRLHWPQLGWLAGAALTAVLTLAVAAPMRRLVEEPCARLRRRLHRAPAPGASVVPLEVGVR